MTKREAALMLERILDPDPWEYILWSDKAKEALQIAIDELEKDSEPIINITNYECCCPKCGEKISTDHMFRIGKIKAMA